jgi:hypothetical protein
MCGLRSCFAQVTQVFLGGRKCKNRGNFKVLSELMASEAPSIHWGQLAKIDFWSVGKIFWSVGRKIFLVDGRIFPPG